MHASIRVPYAPVVRCYQFSKDIIEASNRNLTCALSRYLHSQMMRTSRNKNKGVEVVPGKLHCEALSESESDLGDVKLFRE